MKVFQDRHHAGQVLAEDLKQILGADEALVLALPRGGVPIGYEISKALKIPLDILVVRKLGVPTQKELAFGAIAPEGVRVLNESIIQSVSLSSDSQTAIELRERAELDRRSKLYRGDSPYPNIENKLVIIVDDGLATGATMRAAATWAEMKSAKKTIVVVPIAGSEAAAHLHKEFSDITCLCHFKSSSLFSVSTYYENFDQTTDEEVIRLLQEIQKG